MKVLVIGYGVSGKAAAAFLRKEGHEVVPIDKKGGEGVFPDSPDFLVEGFDLVVLSPGVAPAHPVVQKARSLGIEVIGEIELGLRYLKNRCFGITGSNGKTTTVLLTAHILNQSGRKGRALGNVGEPLTQYLIEADPEEIVILELSSFQLETLRTSKLEMAVVLNITPNHLDRHASMQEYAGAKASIQQCLQEGGEILISTQIQEEFSHLFPAAENFEKEVALLKNLSYTQLGMPSKQSVQAAYLLCKQCKVTDVEFLRGLETFRKPPHRIEWVAEIGGVSYYNDSKSSNIHSVMHAVGRFEGPLVLIVGGVHKGASYCPWIDSFKGKVRHMIAYGKAAPIIEHELKAHFPIQTAGLFADAIAFAKKVAKPKETILLSPGCSSYDQFENYEQRGDVFKRLVRES